MNTDTTKVHIALNSYHFDQAVEFYTEILGNPPEKLTNDYAKFSSPIVPINLTLNRSDGPITGNRINHLGIEVQDSDAVQRAISKFEAAQLPNTEEMNTDCCYARQDKVWVSDPDDNAWEFFFVKEQLPVDEQPACPSNAVSGGSCC